MAFGGWRSGEWCATAGSSRLLKNAHLRRPILRMGTPRARALAAWFDGLTTSGMSLIRPRVLIREMGDAALHLDLFEQPGRIGVFQHPASYTPAGQHVGLAELPDHLF
jgi:hypothetical protein